MTLREFKVTTGLVLGVINPGQGCKKSLPSLEITLNTLLFVATAANITTN